MPHIYAPTLSSQLLRGLPLLKYRLRPLDQPLGPLCSAYCIAPLKRPHHLLVPPHRLKRWAQSRHSTPTLSAVSPETFVTPPTTYSSDHAVSLIQESSSQSCSNEEPISSTGESSSGSSSNGVFSSPRSPSASDEAQPGRGVVKKRRGRPRKAEAAIGASGAGDGLSTAAGNVKRGRPRKPALSSGGGGASGEVAQGGGAGAEGVRERGETPRAEKGVVNGAMTSQPPGRLREEPMEGARTAAGDRPGEVVSDSAGLSERGALEGGDGESSADLTLSEVAFESVGALYSYLQQRLYAHPFPSKVLGHLEVAATLPEGRILCPGDFLVDRWPNPQLVAYHHAASEATATSVGSWSLFAESDEIVRSLITKLDPGLGPFWLTGGEPTHVAAAQSVGGLIRDEQFLLLAHKDLSKRFQAGPSIKLRENLRLAPLQPEHAALVAEHWPYASTSDITFIEALIRSGLPTAAVYQFRRATPPKDLALVAERMLAGGESSGGGEESVGGGGMDEEAARKVMRGKEEWVPVAWALTQPYLAIGMVYVLETHRRQYLGNAVVCALAQEHWLRGWRPYAYVEPKNEASIALFKRLGFADLGPRSWALCEAPSERAIQKAREIGGPACH